jgi:hypothetical protein
MTNARFDTEYTDGILGMTDGVKITCPACGEINLYWEDYRHLRDKELDPNEIDKFKALNPNFRGLIPLSKWLESRNDKDTN